MIMDILNINLLGKVLSLVVLLWLASFALDKKRDIYQVVVLLLGVAVSWVYLESERDLLVFSLGLILGYVSDWIGVYNGYWKYQTQNGYSWWVGLGWGLVTMVVFQAVVLSNYYLAGLLIVSVGLILANKNEKESFAVWSSLLLKLAFLVVYPKLFVLAFSLGVVLEYVAVERLKLWEYQRLSYVQIGTGYGLLVGVVALVVDALMIGFENKTWLLGVFLMVYSTTWLLALLRTQFKGKLIKFGPFVQW